MINFIVVDDIEFFREQINDAILLFSIKSDIPTKIYIFDDYNRDFKKISNSMIENKIYVLDIETPKHNGINEALKIREKDKVSAIIFLTSYETNYYPALLRSNIKFNFISKSEAFKTILYNYFCIVADNIYYNKSNLIFNDHGAFICIGINDIILIYSENNKNIIKTKYNKIVVSKSLDFLLSKLPKYFMRSHRACVVNIKKISYIKNEIVFSDGTKTSLLSRTYKKKIIDEFLKINTTH